MGPSAARWLAAITLMCTAVNHHPASLDPGWVAIRVLGNKSLHHIKTRVPTVQRPHSHTHTHTHTHSMTHVPKGKKKYYQKIYE